MANVSLVPKRTGIHVNKCTQISDGAGRNHVILLLVAEFGIQEAGPELGIQRGESREKWGLAKHDPKRARTGSLNWNCPS